MVKVCLSDTGQWQCSHSSLLISEGWVYPPGHSAQKSRNCPLYQLLVTAIPVNSTLNFISSLSFYLFFQPLMPATIVDYSSFLSALPYHFAPYNLFSPEAHLPSPKNTQQTVLGIWLSGKVSLACVRLWVLPPH
jgi:hypothetical protein